MKTPSDFTVSKLQTFVDSLVAVAKLLFMSHRSHIAKVGDDVPIIIMGNGPSLRQTMQEKMWTLKNHDTLAVNFAAIADEFFEIRPKYYVLADPYFFTGDSDKLKLLHENLEKVDWKMTLFIPFRNADIKFDNKNITVERFNMVGIEGWQWLQNSAFDACRAMPRPRNVLIASIMIAIFMGYKEIYVVGADHSWMQTLSVDENNNVISVQPHFYKDNDTEQKRVDNEYSSYPLHRILYSFYIAFRAYHQIRRYADIRSIKIYNSTPGSFIDAFERRDLQ